MAILDNFIRLMNDQGAQSLRMQTGSYVKLLNGDKTEPVGTGALDTGHIVTILEEVLTPDFSYKTDIEDVSKVFHYNSPFGEFKVTVNIKNNDANVLVEHESAHEEAVPHFKACASKTEYRSSMEDMLHKMLDLNASDLHLKSEHAPMVRIYGEMQPLDGGSILHGDEVKNLISSIIPQMNLDEYDQVRDTDFAFKLYDRARFRCNVFEDLVGMGGAFRNIPNSILSIEDLGLTPAMLRLCDKPKGLILVTGPTNSGKTSTLATMIDYINETRYGHIITIEDPVEYTHKDNKCIINQRQVGSNTSSFKSALRAALREDPDVILVGEIRDLETMKIALETAETGHLVLSSLHTNTAPATIDRIIDQFPAIHQNQIRTMLAESLLGVISQTLCSRRQGGLVAAFELMIITSAVSNMIREAKTYELYSTMQTSRRIGMQLLNDDLLRLTDQAIIAPQEAFLRSILKKEIAQSLTAAGYRGSWSDDETL